MYFINMKITPIKQNNISEKVKKFLLFKLFSFTISETLLLNLGEWLHTLSIKDELFIPDWEEVNNES